MCHSGLCHSKKKALRSSVLLIGIALWMRINPAVPSDIQWGQIIAKIMLCQDDCHGHFVSLPFYFYIWLAPTSYMETIN